MKIHLAGNDGYHRNPQFLAEVFLKQFRNGEFENSFGKYLSHNGGFMIALNASCLGLSQERSMSK